ncbi:hypothetical protein H4R35_005311, partial [Dimargaris xerosporica]
SVVVAAAGVQSTTDATDDPSLHRINQTLPSYGESQQVYEKLPGYTDIFANFMAIIKANTWMPFSATNRAATMQRIRHLPVTAVSQDLLQYLVTENIVLRESYCPPISLGKAPRFSPIIEKYRKEFRDLIMSENVVGQLAVEQILRFGPRQKTRCLAYGLQERWLYHLEHGWVEPNEQRPMAEFLANNWAYNAILRGNVPLAWALALGAEDPTAARTGKVGRLAVYDMTALVVAFDMMLVAVLQDNALAVADMFLHFDLVDLFRPRLAHILLLGVWYARFEAVHEILNHLAREKDIQALGIGADHMRLIEDCFLQPNDNAVEQVRAYILSLGAAALALPEDFDLTSSTDVSDVLQRPPIRDAAAYHLPRLVINANEFSSYSKAVMNMVWNWRYPEQRLANPR